MIEDWEYMKPNRVPRGWHFSGFNEDGIAQFSMVGHIVGKCETDFSVCTTAESRLHIVIADKPLADFFSYFIPTGTGGLESRTKGAEAAGAATWQLHLVHSDHHWPQLLKLWDSRQECRIEGVFFDVDGGDPLYEFGGFDVGCACPLARIDKITLIKKEAGAVAEFFKSMKSSFREFCGVF